MVPWPLFKQVQGQGAGLYRIVRGGTSWTQPWREGISRRAVQRRSPESAQGPGEAVEVAKGGSPGRWGGAGLGALTREGEAGQGAKGPRRDRFGFWILQEQNAYPAPLLALGKAPKMWVHHQSGVAPPSSTEALSRRCRKCKDHPSKEGLSHSSACILEALHPALCSQHSTDHRALSPPRIQHYPGAGLALKLQPAPATWMLLPPSLPPTSILPAMEEAHKGLALPASLGAISWLISPTFPLHPVAFFSEKCVHTLTSASIPSPPVELHVHFRCVPSLVSAPLPGTPIPTVAHCTWSCSTGPCVCLTASSQHPVSLGPSGSSTKNVRKGFADEDEDIHSINIYGAPVVYAALRCK